VVTKIQKAVSSKLREGIPELHRNRNESTAMTSYLMKRGHAEEHIAKLLRVLQPKLSCMSPPMILGSKRKVANEMDISDDEATGDLPVTKPVEEVGFYPYWMGRTSRKLHKAGATTCPWNPKGVATCVWIENEADARSRAATYCKKCWPGGFEDGASDSDSLIDLED